MIDRQPAQGAAAGSFVKGSVTTTELWYVPERITHLYYSPLYATLSPGQKLAYNRLHACYLCEMFVFFEETFPRHYLKATSKGGVPAQLRAQVQSLAIAEQRHAEMFRTLARRLAPGLYTEFQYHFVQMSGVSAAAMRRIFNLPLLFPTLLWIALIQEERAVFYAEEILRSADSLHPEMVESQRKHLADESAHIGVEEELLRLYWNDNRAWVRSLNGLLLGFALREFLGAPKRGGPRLIHYLVEERPELQPREGELAAAMRSLDQEPGFHESLYSRRIVPKTFALFDKYAEFRSLNKSLAGYSPEAPR